MRRELTTNNLLPNAYAIAHLLNEKGGGYTNVTKDLVTAIDRLTSLYAYDMLDDSVKARLEELSASEKEGMLVLQKNHRTVRALEANRLPKTDQGRALRFNAWKGYVPSTPKSGVDVKVADASEHERLIMMGYTKVADYQGDRHERYKGKRAVYRSSTGAKSAFRQGVAQTVHPTWFGVDSEHGYDRTGETAGRVGVDEARVLRKRDMISQRGLVPGEYLMPVWDKDGKIRGYQRSLKAEHQAMLEQNQDLTAMLGAWTGRILEEEISRETNKQLLQAVKEVYDAQGHEPKHADDFTNVADPFHKDPLVRDAWATLGHEIKELAEEMYGRKDFFPVRKESVKDVIGVRSASVTDAWTGLSRWNPKAQEAFRDLFTMFFGTNAMRYLVNAQNLVQDGVSHAKTTIIVRSIFVMWQNLVSNKLHLMSHGIGPVTAAKTMHDKFVEVTAYNQNREKLNDLQVDLATAVGDKAKVNQVQAQITALEDANRKLSIWPLIEAGEYTLVRALKCQPR